MIILIVVAAILAWLACGVAGYAYNKRWYIKKGLFPTYYDRGDFLWLVALGPIFLLASLTSKID